MPITALARLRVAASLAFGAPFARWSLERLVAAPLATRRAPGAGARIGAVWALTGLVEPDLALAQLAEAHRVPGKKPRPSYLVAYPSYLGALVERGLAAGTGPGDFGLERIAARGAHLDAVRLRRVPRARNARADRLANEAVAAGAVHRPEETRDEYL
jgi:hypothetical protein